ncbi:zinc-binding alcohol dehydrogenase [uncultured Amaricoccus sp.]|uniref:zinc-dependent alcohol dehydrogenase n=1 Tax=uncultured Amaricoccus sp. TaxID=339341 RepID=UPI00260DB3C3|nr:zinc-binding alcohol dehydrogenase [uncultured Amaricoccus sp.]
MAGEEARALWMVGPGRAEILLEPVEPGELLIEALFGGISRGTEALVFAGGVPPSERGRMRAPLQAGDFPFPVKYGYATVGRVVGGRLAGREIFALHPHQDRFALTEAMAVPLPEGVPAGRAVLAANMETALNIVWDGGAGPGDRIAVIGAGVVGALAAWLCARLPGAEVTLVDVNPARASLAASLGCRFAAPDAAPEDCDLVIHASGAGAGLRTALAAAGFEATVVEASWYGDRLVELPLGAAFHSRRTRLISSQVGAVAPSRRPRWNHRRRLEMALALLTDPALDALISGETAFADLPARYAAILDDPRTLCHRIRYP